MAVGISVATTRTRQSVLAARDAVRSVATTVGARVSRRARAWTTRWGPEGGDAVLYATSCGFALLTGIFAALAGYRIWAWVALGPYAAAALVSACVARRRVRTRSRAGGPSTNGADFGPARVFVLLFVLLGATLVPLSIEAAHVQPEVVVIAQAGDRLAHGKDVYHTTVHDGRVQSAVPGEPSFESFFPYLPLMAAFGLPNTGRGPVRVTPTRVLFSLVTLVVVGAALVLLRAPREEKMRALQFLTVLPTAALPLATGGDDMPIVAFLLLAMVLAQRRRPGWSGLVLGIVSSMKFTAWPLAALALFAARDAQGRRAPLKMVAGMLVVAGPVVAPFAVSNGRAFVDNVFLFPLGLAGVASPAASNLPGHLIVSAVPSLHVVLPVVVAIVGGALLVHRLVRRPPANAAEVLWIAGWVMLVAILFAPATRVGYLLYPADFFVFGWMFRRADGFGAAVDDAVGALASQPPTSGRPEDGMRDEGLRARRALRRARVRTWSSPS
jgi:hypothetical protein